MGVFRATVLFLAVARVVLGQSLTIPSAWTGTTITGTRATHEGFANDAAQALVNNLASNGSLSDQSDGQALASMYTTLATQDWLSGNKTWKSAVTKNLQAWVDQNDKFGNGTKGSQRTNTNGLQWGLASYYAYKAYNQTSFLTLAQDVWDTTFADFITTDIVATPPKSKPTAPRNITWLNATGCFDKVAAGGVFWLPGVSGNAQIQQDTVGSFSALAGNLYETTGNQTYKTIGMQTVSFMSRTMHNASSDLQYGVFDVQACQVYTGHSPGFQGWYLLPLSIWANVTGDPTMNGLLRQVVSTTVNSAEWTDANGVLKDPNTDKSDNVWDDKAILIRALSEVLRRFSGSADLAMLIEAFIAVQYNELVGNGRSGSNYSTSFTGPAPPAYNSNGNIVALDVFNAAMQVDMLPSDAPPPQPSSSSINSGSTFTSFILQTATQTAPLGSPSSLSSSTPSGTSSNSSSTSNGAIAGATPANAAVLGAFAFIALVYLHI
ncbi:hypothetical protein PENSPDRAFT_758133 [Peniophora sp. CONT]|nr:hypothetical protein PENSPDRAFT_758133 [Peniophora sp. CONT]